MPEPNRELATRWFEEVWNKRRREAIGELLAEGAPIHDGGITVHGPEGFYAFFDRMAAAFSEIHVTVEETIAAGYTFQGRLLRPALVKLRNGNGAHPDETTAGSSRG